MPPQLWLSSTTLALAERLGIPALTTDEAWEDVPNLDIEVRLIR